MKELILSFLRKSWDCLARTFNRLCFFVISKIFSVKFAEWLMIVVMIASVFVALQSRDIYRETIEFTRNSYEKNNENEAERLLDEAWVMLGGNFSAGQINFTGDYSDLDAALLKIKRAESLDSKNPLVTYYYGHYYFAIKNYIEAINKFSQAYSMEKNPRFLNYKALAHYRNGERKQALKHYSEILESQENHCFVHALVNRGNLHVSNGDYDLAILDYESAILCDDSFLSAHFNLAALCIKEGDYERATRNLLKVIDRNPNFKSAYLELSRAMFFSEQFELSFFFLGRVLEVDPDFELAYENLGHTYFEIGDYWSSVYNYEKAIQIKPGKANSFLNLGRSLNMLGQFKRSESSFNSALALSPNNAKALNGLAVALVGQGKYEKGIERYYQAISLKPCYIDARYNLALLYSSLGDRDLMLHNLYAIMNLDEAFGKVYYKNVSDWIAYEESVRQ